MTLRTLRRKLETPEFFSQIGVSQDAAHLLILLSPGRGGLLLPGGF